MQESKLNTKSFLIVIVISMVLWGLSWPSAKVLSHYGTAGNLVVYRYIVVLASLFPLLLLFNIKLTLNKQAWLPITVSGLLLALYSFIFFRGIQKGMPGAGGVLVTTLNPIMAYGIGLILQKRKPTKNESIGLVLGLIAGAVLLKIWQNLDGLLSSGNLFFLLAALTWAVMSKFTSTASKYGSSLSFSLWQYIVTLLCLLPMVNWGELESALHITNADFWINLFFSSAIVTTLATTAYFYATTRVGPEKASSFIFMVPLCAAISSWLWLGEVIQVHTIIGGLLGISAVYIINRK